MGTITILPETTKNPLELIGRRAGVCYGTDISNEKKNIKRGKDCIKSGHGRTLEFVDVHMIIDGYSAKVLREFYTHIGGSPTRLQSSTRYINYSKGDGFAYVTPKTIMQDETALELWQQSMKATNELMKLLIEERNIPVEDATMLLPLSYCSKIVDKRNLRNLIEMSHVRECNRAYLEFRELFSDIKNALREYSAEWKWIVDNLFKPKCEVYGYCDENKSCGRKPKKEKLHA